MRLLLLSFSLSIFLFACKSEQGAQVALQKDFYLTIHRTACFGTCPDFTLTVDANGNVNYTGRNFVENVGMFQKRISRKQVKALATAIEESNFWEYKEVYDDPGITDLPSASTECVHNGKRRKVVNRIGAPESLGKLQLQLEEIIGPDGYQPVAGPKAAN